MAVTAYNYDTPYNQIMIDWQSYLASRFFLIGGLVMLYIPSNNEFLLNIIREPFQFAHIVFALAIAFIFFNPIRSINGKLDCGTIYMRVRQFSLKKYQNDIYEELIREHALLETAGVVWEASDWERRIQLAFEECQFGTNAQLPVSKESKVNTPSTAQSLGH